MREEEKRLAYLRLGCRLRARAGNARPRSAVALALVAFVASVAFGSASAADSHQVGSITNVTATTDGLMVMLDNGPPTNCAATPYGWMLIPEINKTMVAATLALWLVGRTRVTVYTSGTYAGGMCVINQIDPE